MSKPRVVLRAFARTRNPEFSGWRGMAWGEDRTQETEPQAPRAGMLEVRHPT